MTTNATELKQTHTERINLVQSDLVRMKSFTEWVEMAIRQFEILFEDQLSEIITQHKLEPQRIIFSEYNSIKDVGKDTGLNVQVHCRLDGRTGFIDRPGINMELKEIALSIKGDNDRLFVTVDRESAISSIMTGVVIIRMIYFVDA